MSDDALIQYFDDLLTKCIEISEFIASRDATAMIFYERGNLDAIVASTLLARLYFERQRACMIRGVSLEELSVELENKELFFITLGFSLKAVNPFHDPETQIVSVIPAEPESLESSPYLLNSGVFGYFDQQTSISACVYFVVSNLVKKSPSIYYLPLLASYAIYKGEKVEGLHEVILHDGIEAKVIEEKHNLSLPGINYFTLADSLLYSTDPIFPGISGVQPNINKVIQKSGIELESTAGKRKIIDLQENEVNKLASTLVITLSQLAYQEFLPPLVRQEILIKSEKKSLLTHFLRDFSLAISTAVESGNGSKALSVLIGERSESLKSIRVDYYNYLRQLHSVLNLLLQDEPDLTTLSKLQYFELTEKINPGLLSKLGSLLNASGKINISLPLLIYYSPNPETTRIGLRGSKTVLPPNKLEKLARFLTKQSIYFEHDRNHGFLVFSTPENVINDIETINTFLETE